MASKSRVLPVALLAAVITLLTIGVAAQRPANPGKSNQAPGRSGEVKQKGITEEQKANVRERVTLARQIIDKHQAEADAQGLSADWRRPLLESLLPLSLDSLHEVETAESLEALAAAVASEAAEPDLGAVGEDLVYTPITPCRYIDTRNIGGRITGYRGYDLASNGAAYGGSAACAPTALFGVGDDAFGALAMNVTIVSPASAPGWLAIKPTTTAATSSWLNWYQAGGSVAVANQGIVTPDRSEAGSEFWVYTSAAAHVLVDIFGAFLAPEATTLAVMNATSAVSCANNSDCAVDAPCPVVWTLTGGGYLVDAYVSGFHVVGSRGLAGVWRCEARNESGATRTLGCYAICARVPGR